MRRHVWIALLAVVALAGCSADGTTTGDVTFSAAGVPFTFRVPATFTKASVDELNSRGSVVAVRALTKVDVLAVRRWPGGPAPGEVRQRILGASVTSRVTDVGRGWALECQWTAGRRADVLAACDEALRSLRFR